MEEFSLFGGPASGSSRRPSTSTVRLGQDAFRLEDRAVPASVSKTAITAEGFTFTVRVGYVPVNANQYRIDSIVLESTAPGARLQAGVDSELRVYSGLTRPIDKVGPYIQYWPGLASQTKTVYLYKPPAGRGVRVDKGSNMIDVGLTYDYSGPLGNGYGQPSFPDPSMGTASVRIRLF